MAAEMSDNDLIGELAKFGETVTKLTAKTRPIYLKKLNHLHAREKMTENLGTVPNKRPGRRTRASLAPVGESNYRLDLNGDDDDDVGEMIKKTMTTTSEPKTRRRTVHGGGFLSSTPTRMNGRRSTAFGKSFEEREVSPLQPSFDRGEGGGGGGSLDQDGALDRDGTLGRNVGNRSGLGLMDYSDSEQIEEPGQKETASIGINTSSHLDLSRSFFGNTSRNQTGLGDVSISRPAATPTRSTVFQSNNHHEGWPDRVVGSEAEGSSKWQFISKLLLTCVLVFFVILVSLYGAVRVGLLESWKSPANVNLLCGPNKDCLNSDQMKIFVNILNALASRAGVCDCGDATVRRSLSRSEVINLLRGNSETVDAKYSFQSFLTFISDKDFLKIRLLDGNFKLTDDDSEVTHLESVRADMSFLCRLRKSFVKVAIILLTVVAGFTVIGGAIFLVRRALQRRKEEKKEVHRLIHDIISLLQHHSVDCQSNPSLEPFLPMLHVRDALIPLDQREQKYHLWDRALDLIAAHESRVREEIQVISGSKQCVWRWLDASTTDLPRHTERKTLSWANADTTQVSSSLKISNVLDDLERLDNNIRDSILDRCGSYPGILHIDCYRNCVYMKFVSESSAGQAFKFLHGWLYKGKLVSVQYVTPLFYRTLFPDSVNAMVPLRPSTYKRRSTILAGTEATGVRSQ